MINKQFVIKYHHHKLDDYFIDFIICFIIIEIGLLIFVFFKICLQKILSVH